MSISFKGAKKFKPHNGLSKKSVIYSVLPSPEYVFKLNCGDETLNPVVSIGDYVQIGTKLADFESYDTIPCHSSVSGTVTSITESEIRINNDMLYTSPNYTKKNKAEELTTREMLWLIRESGVCEIRNGIPAHLILGTDKTPEYVIVPTFDSDPYVSSPQIFTEKNTSKILSGLTIAMNILNTKKAIIAITDDCKGIFSNFKLKLRFNENVIPYKLKARYPQDKDDILIKTLTGKTASNANSVIISAETLCNIYDAVTFSKPVTEKIVTVSGDDILPPNNYRVPVGLPISSLLSDCGYTSPDTVIYGGVIDGKILTDTNTPVSRNTKAIIAFSDSSNIPKYRKKR